MSEVKTLVEAKETWRDLEWRQLEILLLKQWQDKSLNDYSVAPLSGGHSRDFLFTLSIHNSSFVLRMSQASREGGEQVAEFSMLAGNAGLGPKVYFKSDDSCVLLMEMMPGRTVCIDELKTPEGIKALAQGIYKAHQLSVANVTNAERLFSNVFQWAKEQKDYAFLRKGLFQKAFEEYQELLSTIKKTTLTPCLLHGDINPSNIFLKDNQCYFIDWEFAGIGQPELELARTCEWFAYDDAQMMTFLACYFVEDISAELKQSIQAMRKATYLEMFWLCLSFLPQDIISEEKLLNLIAKTPSYRLKQMAMGIEKGIERATDNESLLIEAVGFFNAFRGPARVC